MMAWQNILATNDTFQTWAQIMDKHNIKTVNTFKNSHWFNVPEQKKQHEGLCKIWLEYDKRGKHTNRNWRKGMVKFTDKQINDFFNSICNLVRHGFKIKDACKEAGVSMCYIYGRLSKEEIDEIKNLKLDLTQRKKLLNK